MTREQSKYSAHVRVSGRHDHRDQFGPWGMDHVITAKSAYPVNEALKSRNKKTPSFLSSSFTLDSNASLDSSSQCPRVSICE